MNDATPEEFPGATPHLCVRSVEVARPLLPGSLRRRRAHPVERT